MATVARMATSFFEGVSRPAVDNPAPAATVAPDLLPKRNTSEDANSPGRQSQFSDVGRTSAKPATDASA